MTIWQLLVVLAVIGHFGMMLAAYNRINSLGLKRSNIKLMVKVMFLYTVALPIVLAWTHFDLWRKIFWSVESSWSFPPTLIGYGTVCLAAMVLLGIPWLIHRPIFASETVGANRTVNIRDVADEVDPDLPLTRKCRLQSQIPQNQIFELSIETIELPVKGLPAALDGYRISQISDLHLTGHIHPSYSRFVVERATDWQPDMFIVSGDIIDAKECIDWLPEIFNSAVAPDGSYFVLGNHDKRIRDPNQTREAMGSLGWIDLGGKTREVTLRGVKTLMIGNEYPWFDRPELAAEGDEDFRLMISHSPDQIHWARARNVDLVLAGHTHGGQGRLPVAGPLLSPSIHGSRFASGDFYKAPTTMHVSRGLSGTHLIRINCRPELSLIILRTCGEPSELQS